MAYEPTVWSTGDIITAEKLNKIENAIGGVYYVDLPTEGDALSVTWQDIYDAYQSGKLVIGRTVYNSDYIEIEFAMLAYICNNEVGFMPQTSDAKLISCVSNSATGQLSIVLDEYTEEQPNE